LHGDVRALVLRHPLLEREQLARRCRERPHVQQRLLSILRDSHAGDDDILVNVEPGALRVQNFHDLAPRETLAGGLASSKSRFRPSRLERTRADGLTVWGARGVPGPTQKRAHAHQAKADLSASDGATYLPVIPVRTPSPHPVNVVRVRHPAT